MLERMLSQGTLLPCWWEYKLVQLLWESIWWFLRKWEISLHSLFCFWSPKQWVQDLSLVHELAFWNLNEKLNSSLAQGEELGSVSSSHAILYWLPWEPCLNDGEVDECRWKVWGVNRKRDRMGTCGCYVT